MGSAIDAFVGSRQAPVTARGTGSAIDAFAQYEANKSSSPSKPKVSTSTVQPATTPNKSTSLFSKIKNVVKGAAEGAKETGEKSFNTVAAGTAGSFGIEKAGVQ